MELGELLDPGKPSRTDKVSIIADAVKAITQLRAEAHQLRQLNKFLEASPVPRASQLFAPLLGMGLCCDLSSPSPSTGSSGMRARCVWNVPAPARLTLSLPFC